MPVEIAQVAIVITAASHNPSILHPSFLRAEGIVPSTWEALENVSTPVLGVVKYSELTFTAEPSKVQVVQIPFSDKDDSIRAVTQKYVEVLPKVPYRGVGINPQAFVEMSEPVGFLTARFLKDGVWNQQPSPTKDFQLKFVYDVLGDVRLTLTLAAATAERPGERKHGISAAGNYHGSANDVSAVVARLSRFKDVCDHFKKLVGEVLNG